MNYKTIFLLLACTLLPYLLSAQQNLQKLSPEVLSKMLDTTTHLSQRVKVLNELAFQLRNKKREEAIRYGNEALTLATELGDSLEMTYSLIALGLGAKKEGDLTKAENYFLQSASIRKAVGAPREEASAYNNLGLLFQHSDAEKAKVYFRKGLRILTSTPYIKRKATIHNNYGNFLRREQLFDEAVLQLDTVLSIRRQIGHKSGIGNAYLNKASLYLDMEDKKRFEQLLDSAMLFFIKATNTSGQAKCYNQKGLYHLRKKNWKPAEKQFEMAASFSALKESDRYTLKRNQAAVAFGLGNLQQALILSQSCIDFFQGSGNKREEGATLINIGSNYYRRAIYDTAATYYRKSLEVLKGINELELEAQASLLLAGSYGYLKKNEEALQQYFEYGKRRDKLSKRKSSGYRRLLDQSELLFQNAQLKLVEVSSELELTRLREQRQQLFGGIAILLLVLLVIAALTIAIVNRRKKEKVIYEIDQLLLEQERMAYDIKLEEQENERNRIAQDLHDRLGSMFSIIKFSLGSIESKVASIEDGQRDNFLKVNKLIDGACDEVRNVAYDLKNSILAKFGLRVALKSLVGSLENEQMKIELQTHGIDHRLPNKIEVNVYRIVQELLGNALKHSDADNLYIQVNQFEETLNITIEDDGIGFQTDHTKGGMGLHNVASRVRKLEGKLLIDSGKGNGTTIIIDIPCKEVK